MIRVPVLCYHSVSDEPVDGTRRWSVSPGDFAEQMALLGAQRRSSLTVGRYVELLRAGGPMPPRPVLVTFDDGFADLLTTALPALRRYGLAATAYVITDRVGAAAPVHSPRALDWDGLGELAAAGVEIGSHGHTHAPLDCLPPARLVAETTVSRRLLERRLCRPVDSFAYPYGYHGARVRDAVRAAGYRSACAVKNALSHPQDDPFALARVLVERDTGAAGIEAILAGRGYPLAWRGERLRTRCWRAYRRARHALATRTADPVDRR